MLTVAAIAAFRLTRRALNAFAHVINHATAWIAFPDTFRYGACLDCGPDRQTAANERRQAATGHYYR